MVLATFAQSAKELLVICGPFCDLCSRSFQSGKSRFNGLIGFLLGLASPYLDQDLSCRSAGMLCFITQCYEEYSVLVLVYTVVLKVVQVYLRTCTCASFSLQVGSRCTDDAFSLVGFLEHPRKLVTHGICTY